MPHSFRVFLRNEWETRNTCIIADHNRVYSLPPIPYSSRVPSGTGGGDFAEIAAIRALLPEPG